MNQKVDINVVNGKLVANPDTVTIKTKNGDQVVWRGHGGPISIRFNKDGTPFGSDTFAGANETDTHSGQSLIRPNGIVSFHYTVTMTLPRGGDLKLDPGVDVDGGGGPPESPKKKEG